jgi:ABC-type nitrate/sulfonate/bicarbonate transport system substrate-binding protein
VRIIIAIVLTILCIARGETLRVSVTRMPVSAPVFVAQERGLFKKAGLQVELREYELGKWALEDLLTQKLDIGFAAVTPMVYKCIAGEQFKILATVASSTGSVALVARKDLGIQRLTDMRGKRIGLVKETSGEYFFETMRVLNRVPRDAMSVENRTPQGLLDGLREGSLDMVSIWEPEIQTLRATLTNRLMVFYGDGLYTFSWNMITLPQTVEKRRADLEKFVDVLFEAANLIEADPAAISAELIARRGAQGRALAIGLRDNRYRPQIGQELLVQMEGEARWIMNREGRTNSPPNFLRWVDTSVLKKVHPSAVSIIE